MLTHTYCITALLLVCGSTYHVRKYNQLNCFNLCTMDSSGYMIIDPSTNNLEIFIIGISDTIVMHSIYGTITYKNKMNFISFKMSIEFIYKR